ncbi:MAG: SDR family NAD(P)-dependent oxidoreductase [Actinomycetota bacterium]
MSPPPLSDQVALLTGAGGGLGEAVAAGLVGAGAHVVAADIDPEAAGHVAETHGDRASHARMDVTDRRSVHDVVERVHAEHGRLDVLVNLAGFTRDTRIDDMTDEQWDEVVDVCLTGSFNTARACTPHMRARRYGRIVNIASRAYLGNPGQANYSAAKAGVIGLTKALAKELGRDGITVNAVAPGVIATAAVRAHPKFDKIEQRALRENAIPRLGEPDDVAHAVVFLASPTAGFITGDVLHVTGGRFG